MTRPLNHIYLSTALVLLLNRRVISVWQPHNASADLALRKQNTLLHYVDLFFSHINSVESNLLHNVAQLSLYFFISKIKYSELQLEKGVSSSADLRIYIFLRLFIKCSKCPN